MSAAIQEKSGLPDDIAEEVQGLGEGKASVPSRFISCCFGPGGSNVAKAFHGADNGCHVGVVHAFEECVSQLDEPFRRSDVLVWTTERPSADSSRRKSSQGFL